MDFQISTDQQMLQDSVRRALERHFSLDPLRALDDGQQNLDLRAWEMLKELGIPGLLVPETHGGLGMGLHDAALIAEELGRQPVGSPFLGTAVLAPLALRLAGSPEQQETWLPRLASGEAVVGVALLEALGPVTRHDGVRWNGQTLSGTSWMALDAAIAEAFIVADRSGALFLVKAQDRGLRRERVQQIDASRPVVELHFEQVAAEPLPLSSSAVVDRLRAAAWVILSSDTLGAGWAMIDKAVGYAKERKQFGRLIGSYQAVKHLCAEMAASLEPTRAMVWQAAIAFDAQEPEALLLSAHLKAHTSEVGTFVARTATEVHGGIGITDLLGLHYWFKRIGFNRQMFGGPERVRRFAAALQGWGVAAQEAR